MPELPEVETMRRGILPIVGATITQAERPPCVKRPIKITPRIDRLRKRIVGKRIEAVERLGKRVVICIETGDRIVIEPRMTGLVLISQPPTIEHLRLRLQLENSSATEVLFWDRRGLGVVSLLSASEYELKLTDGKLGPDALAISAEEFPQRFRGRKREIKVALLDQAIVLGIGNLYASEILHLAGVHPAAKCHRISRPRWQRIYDCMRNVLEIAIEYEGSTLSDGTYRNALNEAGGYQNEHRVYDRAGETCPSCGAGTIERIVQAQRSTFFCKRCQKR